LAQVAPSPEEVSSLIAGILHEVKKDGGGDTDKFLPDLDLVDTASIPGDWYAGPSGLLVCKVGGRADRLQAGDVLTHVVATKGNVPLALDADAMQELSDSLEFGELSPAKLRDWGQGTAERLRASQVKKVADELAKELEMRGETEAVVEEVRVRVEGALVKALEGSYAQEVKLTVWRRSAEANGGGPPVYTKLEAALPCRRIRDPSRRAPSHTPERYVCAATGTNSVARGWDLSDDNLEKGSGLRLHRSGCFVAIRSAVASPSLFDFI
jgi:hypothetical protein